MNFKPGCFYLITGTTFGHSDTGCVFLCGKGEMLILQVPPPIQNMRNVGDSLPLNMMEGFLECGIINATQYNGKITIEGTNGRSD